MIFLCNYNEVDEIEVEDHLDPEDDVLISINPQNENAHVFLSKEDAEKLALHILDILGKTV